jgi:hypothetical protein
MFLARGVGFHSRWVEYAAYGLSMPLFFCIHYRRSRHIPASLQRRTIEDFEREKGVSYDPNIHHMHHKIPFAKGGGHTPVNLTVVSKEENQRRGDKMPTLVDWIRTWMEGKF